MRYCILVVALILAACPRQPDSQPESEVEPQPAKGDIYENLLTRERIEVDKIVVCQEMFAEVDSALDWSDPQAIREGIDSLAFVVDGSADAIGAASDEQCVATADPTFGGPVIYHLYTISEIKRKFEKLN